MTTHFVRWIGSVVGAGVLVAMSAAPARAHCDSMDGPVVKAAQAALDAGDVNLVLIWVPDQAEGEVRDAFTRVSAVRKTGGDARHIADRFFFETVVRLHRAGEGEPYTGLKPAGTDPGPAIRAGDEAIASGTVKPILEMVLKAAEHGLLERFAHVLATRGAATADLKAGRAHVEAYVLFMHYVENLHAAIEASPHGHAAETEIRR